MSTRTAPKTEALDALIDAHAVEMQLPTIKARFPAMAAEATREQQHNLRSVPASRADASLPMD